MNYALLMLLIHLIHPVIILNIFKFTSFVLFGTHILLYKSSNASQLPLDLSKLAINR